jgi:hypothetical protein
MAPDLYAIAGALLKRSGAFLRVFEHDGHSKYLSDLELQGATWRKTIDALKQPITVERLRSARPSGGGPLEAGGCYFGQGLEASRTNALKDHSCGAGQTLGRRLTSLPKKVSL